MGWERRGAGLYYYDKARRGGRVVSVYRYGGGHFTGLAETFQAAQRARRRRADQERAERRRQREEARAITDETAAVAREVNRYLTAVLLASGYHQHRRQWRKRRRAP